MIRTYFEYVGSAIAEHLASADPSFAASTNLRAQSVLWVTRVPAEKMPYRFIYLKGFPGSEEFGIDIGWSDSQELPSLSYFSALLERGRSLESRQVPDVPCQVPVISDLVLGPASDFFEIPTFQANPPSMERLAQAVTDSFESDASAKRLRSIFENAGIEDEFEAARATTVARRVAPELFNVYEGPMSTDWQFIELLTGVRASDCDSALSGPCAMAGFLLVEYALPFLLSHELTPTK